MTKEIAEQIIAKANIGMLTLLSVQDQKELAIAWLKMDMLKNQTPERR